MSISLNAAADGLSATLQLGGVDIVTLDANKTSAASGKLLEATSCTGNSATATMSKQVPVSNTATTLVAADTGKCVYALANITVPNAVFQAGDAVTIYNGTAGNITILQGAGLTLALGASSGNRTLATNGMATVWFLNPNIGIITGSGLT